MQKSHVTVLLWLKPNGQFLNLSLLVSKAGAVTAPGDLEHSNFCISALLQRCFSWFELLFLAEIITDSKKTMIMSR